MKTKIARLPLVALAILLALGSSSRLEAGGASVSASSFSFRVKNDSDSDDNNFYWSKPTSTDTIAWTSGTNWTDQLPHFWTKYGPEPKFAVGPPIAGRVFKGFARFNGPAPLCGSRASTTGSGLSGVGGFVAKYISYWTVNAWGPVGTIPRPPLGTCVGFRGFDANATGKDPITVSAAQLADAGINESKIDLVFGVGLTAGSWSQIQLADPPSYYSETGGFGLEVSFENAAGTWRVLSIQLNASGATVLGPALDFPGDVGYYEQAVLDPDPSGLFQKPIGAGTLQNSLQSSALNHFLDHPVYLVIRLRNIAVPTQALDGEGTLIALHVDSNVAQSGEEDFISSDQ